MLFIMVGAFRMADILPFKRPKPQDPGKRILCESVFHRWDVVSTPFDVKLGKLVTRYRCKRCGAVKTEAR